MPGACSCNPSRFAAICLSSTVVNLCTILFLGNLRALGDVSIILPVDKMM